MTTLVYIILASFIVSLLSLTGAILFVVKEKKLQKYMILFVALAAGSLLGTALLHLLPESVDLFENISQHSNTDEHEHFFLPSYFILLGILIFYTIEKFIHWHHHHDLDCHKHSVTTLSLIGDGFHNFIDGIVIGAAFVADIRLGVVTTIAIALHEIPQEIGDLSILLHGGFSKIKALIWNFISAIFSVVGGIFAYIFLGSSDIIPYLLSLTAGMFIYISLADIIPELHKNHNLEKGLVSTVFILGIVLAFLMTNFIAH